MDRKFIKQIRKALIFESLFSGASSLSKLFDETEDELEDMMKSIDKKVKSKSIFDSKLFKNEKY
ncbi:MAG: hypothetical protein ACYCYE_12325 [Clostridia bacterium]